MTTVRVRLAWRSAKGIVVVRWLERSDHDASYEAGFVGDAFTLRDAHVLAARFGGQVIGSYLGGS